MRTLILAVILLLGAPGVAGAAVAPGDYGGGRIADGRYGTGDSWMWARVGADGRARIGGAVNVRCGLVRFDAEVTPAADGTFNFTRVRTYRGPRSDRRAVATVTGRFKGGKASGEVSARLRVRTAGGPVKRCTTGGSRPWQLRRPPGAVAPGGARPATTYLGLTGQAGAVPRPFLLRVGADARKVAFSMFEYTRTCRRRAYLLNEVTRGARIGPDGSFSIRGSFALRYRDVPRTERFRVRVDGGFRAGAVSGTLRVTSIARRRGTDRVVDRCDTGPVSFGARP